MPEIEEESAAGPLKRVVGVKPASVHNTPPNEDDSGEAEPEDAEEAEKK